MRQCIIAWLPVKPSIKCCRSSLTSSLTLCIPKMKKHFCYWKTSHNWPANLFKKVINFSLSLHPPFFLFFPPLFSYLLNYFITPLIYFSFFFSFFIFLPLSTERILVDCQTNGSMVLVILLQLWNKDDFSLLVS